MMDECPLPPLSRHFEGFIKELLEQRRYENASQVIEAALTLLQRKQAQEAALADALREGIESGEAVDFDMEAWLDEQERLDDAA